MTVVSFCFVHQFFTVVAFNYQMMYVHFLEIIFTVLKISHIQKLPHFIVLHQISVVRARYKLICFLIVCCMRQFKWNHVKRTNSKWVSFWNTFHQFACSDVHVLNGLVIGVNLNACIHYFLECFGVISVPMTEQHARNVTYLVVNPSKDFLVIASAVKKNNLACT